MIYNFFSSWSTADWVGVILSLILFVAGAWVTRVLGAKQEQTLNEVHSLQEATAELQIREKIGVIAGKINAIEMSKNKRPPSAELLRFAMNIWQDGLSVLPLFKFASERLQVEYRDTLAHALRVLHESPYYHEQLEGMFTEIGEHVAKLENDGLKCSTILKGALQLTSQELKINRNKLGQAQNRHQK